MSIEYRAIWQDDSADLAAFARGQFLDWVQQKHAVSALPEPASSLECSGAKGVQVQIKVEEGAGDACWILRMVLHEEQKRGDRYTTTLTAFGEHAEQWLWADLERVAQDSFRRVEIRAPRLVRSLLESGTDPRRGPILLGSKVRAYREDEVPALVDLLEDDERDVPIVLFTFDPSVEVAVWNKRLQDAARTLAGLGVVALLPPDAEKAFSRAVGQDMAVWGGALRIYLPGIDLRDPAPYRHRYLRARQVTGQSHRAGVVVGRMLSKYMNARRPPILYPQLRPLLDGRSSEDFDELLDHADDEIRSLRAEILDLEEQMLSYASDLEEAHSLNNRLSENLRHIIASENDIQVSDVPVEVEDCGQAADLCGKHLSLVALPAEACRDLDDLDSATESRAWGQAAWRGFRALDAYASEAPEFAGGFREWCQQTANPWKWNPSSKKLAMSESETVMQHPRFMEARRFKVSESVDPQGSVIMQSHLKVAEGGGDLAPRIYFHDDTKGETGKVHIGFFGPHFHVPNTKS